MTNQETFVYPENHPIFAEAQMWIDDCIDNGTPDDYENLVETIRDEALDSMADPRLVKATLELVRERFES